MFRFDLVLSIKPDWYLDMFQGLCFECGSENKHCAKLGYPAIEYKKVAEKYSRTGVKLYLNTGSITPFCRKYSNWNYITVIRLGHKLLDLC